MNVFYIIIGIIFLSLSIHFLFSFLSKKRQYEEENSFIDNNNINDENDDIF